MMFAGISRDADALAYFAAITAAGSSISAANQSAVNAFIVGCKADGIWSAIKASCLLAGPDSLAGALVPLVGTAPTNNGPFVAGDYSRTTGLVGNGSSKYLESNYTLTSALRNNRHLSVFATTITTVNAAYAGTRQTGTENPSTQILSVAGQAGILTRASALTSNQATTALNAIGLMGISRAALGSYVQRGGGTDQTATVNSISMNEDPVQVFKRPITVSHLYSTSRLSFYSIGESLNLALLDARLTAYMAALT